MELLLVHLDCPRQSPLNSFVRSWTHGRWLCLVLSPVIKGIDILGLAQTALFKPALTMLSSRKVICRPVPSPEC